jgi:hypothetical protein
LEDDEDDDKIELTQSEDKVEDSDQQDESESESEDDVMAIIAEDVVNSMQSDIDDNDDSEAENDSDTVFVENKSKLKRLFYERFIRYAQMFGQWENDDVVKAIIRKSRSKNRSFSKEDAALDKHKQIVFSRLRKAVDNYFQTDNSDDNDDQDTKNNKIR